jgi:hypothetical protein
MTQAQKFRNLCKSSDRCIEEGIMYNIELTIKNGTRTPEQGLKLMEKISYMDIEEAVLFDVKITEND